MISAPNRWVKQGGQARSPLLTARVEDNSRLGKRHGLSRVTGRRVEIERPQEAGDDERETDSQGRVGNGD